MMTVNGYEPYRPDPGARANCHMLRQGYDWATSDFGGVVEWRPTGRVMVVIEGEEDLVMQLLGRNFIRRLGKMQAQVSGITPRRVSPVDEPRAGE